MGALHSTTRHTTSKLRICTRSAIGRSSSGLGFEKTGERAAAFQANKVALQQLGKVQRRLAGERIVVAHHGGELVVAVRRHVQAPRVGAIDDHSQIHLAAAYALRGVFTPPCLEARSVG